MKLFLLLLVPVWAQTCDTAVDTAVELAIKEPDEALELLQVKKVEAGKVLDLVGGVLQRPLP